MSALDLARIREDGSLGTPESDAQDEAVAAAVAADAQDAGQDDAETEGQQDERQDEGRAAAGLTRRRRGLGGQTLTQG